jgi:hypothetical protein
MGTADELRLENEWIEALDSLARNSTETEADKQMRADIIRLKSRLDGTDEFLGSFLQTILDEEIHDSRIVAATQAVQKYCAPIKTSENATKFDTNSRTATQMNMPSAALPNTLTGPTHPPGMSPWQSQRAEPKPPAPTGEKIEGNKGHPNVSEATPPRTQPLTHALRGTAEGTPNVKTSATGSVNQNGPLYSNIVKSEWTGPTGSMPTDRIKGHWLDLLKKARGKLQEELTDAQEKQTRTGFGGEALIEAANRLEKVSILIDEASRFNISDRKSMINSISKARTELASVGIEFG